MVYWVKQDWCQFVNIISATVQSQKKYMTIRAKYKKIKPSHLFLVAHWSPKLESSDENAPTVLLSNINFDVKLSGRKKIWRDIAIYFGKNMHNKLCPCTLRQYGNSWPLLYIAPPFASLSSHLSGETLWGKNGLGVSNYCLEFSFFHFFDSSSGGNKTVLYIYSSSDIRWSLCISFLQLVLLADFFLHRFFPHIPNYTPRSYILYRTAICW